MSKVYFIDFHTHARQNIFQKLEILLEKAGFDQMDMEKKFVAIKMHFGEPGNLAYIRPNFVAPVAKKIRSKGGFPYLTDANTLYKGGRSNAVDHLQAAHSNGFNYPTTGCDVIIADGIKGTDYREIEINQKHCKTAKVGSALADADVLISMAHFKGHEMAGIGGTLKNVGMGSGAVGGKLEMHSDASPVINRSHCTGCEVCVENCAHDAIHLDEESIATIDYDKCVGCGQCIAVCRYDAPQPASDSEFMQEKMVEYAWAILKDKPAFHISFISDVSPQCDCWGFNDIPLVQNIGILASADPVALDRACTDLVNEAPALPNSQIGKTWKPGDDKFNLVFPKISWKKGLDYAEKLGLGEQKYELIKVG